MCIIYYFQYINENSYSLNLGKDYISPLDDEVDASAFGRSSAHPESACLASCACN